MVSKVLGILYLVLVLGGVISTCLMGYFFLSMLGSARPDKRHHLKFMGPAILFLPNVWTDLGNKARIRTLIWVAVAGLCLAGLELITMVTKTGPS
jgi:Na+/melibiose symporter-like transporter